MSAYVARMKVKSRARLFGLAILASGCVDRGRAAGVREVEPFVVPADPAPRHVEGGRRVDAPVILVAIDGVRWQEVFQGTDRALSRPPQTSAASLLPNLYALGRDRGAFVGAPGQGTISASGPTTSRSRGTPRCSVVERRAARTTTAREHRCRPSSMKLAPRGRRSPRLRRGTSSISRRRPLRERSCRRAEETAIPRWIRGPALVTTGPIG